MVTLTSVHCINCFHIKSSDESALSIRVVLYRCFLCKYPKLAIQCYQGKKSDVFSKENILEKQVRKLLLLFRRPKIYFVAL